MQQRPRGLQIRIQKNATEAKGEGEEVNLKSRKTYQPIFEAVLE